ncbi:Polycomb group RING finger protein 3 [Hordeum vulgare]|nr:Polycomb group RING finger protein 3 [Hordeum vulgare]
MAGVSRVSRAALTACLTCPLCKGYFREASALADCGHTFCRDCIIKKIDEQGIESCPVCNAALGIAPEEKLRADPQIQAIRDKAFPPKIEVDASEAPTTELPTKIKERSISSLVKTPKMATQPTLKERRPYAARRKFTSHLFSVGKLPNNSEDHDQKTEMASAQKSTKMTTSANKKKNSADIFEDRQNCETIDNEELHKPLRSLVVASVKKSQKLSCLRESGKNRTTTEDSLRESPEEDSHDGITNPVWFSLVTSPNQVEAKRLPQLVKNFYRIGDGTIQVSSILKLIMKKLELASDVKVEILCHGKPVCPSTTLHCLLKQWLSRKPKYKVQRPLQPVPLISSPPPPPTSSLVWHSPVKGSVLQASPCGQVAKAATFVDKFKDELPPDVIAVMCALFKIDDKLQNDVEDALIAHGGIDALDHTKHLDEAAAGGHCFLILLPLLRSNIDLVAMLDRFNISKVFPW